MTEWSRETWTEMRQGLEPGSIERGSIETLSEFQEYSRIGGAAMEPAQVTQKAVGDIGKLASGMDRADVALDALRDSVLTPKQVEQLQALLKQVSQTQAAPSAAQSPTAGRIETVDGHQAVVGKIAVNGQQLETLLSEGSFNKDFLDQEDYAESLNYRIATREESRAYVESLLAKEADKSINAADVAVLKTYRERHVEDTEGHLEVDGQRVRDIRILGRGKRKEPYSLVGNGRVYTFEEKPRGPGYPDYGALFVRASAESK